MGGDCLGYKIHYGIHTYKKIINSNGRRQYRRILSVVTATIIAAVVILCVVYWDSFTKWLLPGDYQTTIDAFRKFTVSIKSGTQAREAIEVFCRDIIDYAAK